MLQYLAELGKVVAGPESVRCSADVDIISDHMTLMQSPPRHPSELQEFRITQVLDADQDTHPHND